MSDSGIKLDYAAPSPERPWWLTAVRNAIGNLLLALFMIAGFLVIVGALTLFILAVDWLVSLVSK